MSSTDEIVDKALESMDEANTTVPDPNPADVPTSDDDTPEKGKELKEDDGYTADELEEDEPEQDDKKSTKSVEASNIDTSGLNPEAKYIVDNLPYITARVKDGDTIRELQVKSWTQLPEDVTFASKRDELAFMNALTAQENEAVRLQAKFQQTQQQEQNKDFERRENETIRLDIAKLQRSGDLPKFKVDPDSPEFSKDPAYQETQKVLDFMNERNNQYLSEYQQGRSYKHIGFEEAFHMYQKSAPKKAAEDAEDKERDKIAKNQNNNRGLSSREMKRPTVKPGTRIEHILDRIDQEW